MRMMQRSLLAIGLSAALAFGQALPTMPNMPPVPPAPQQNTAPAPVPPGQNAPQQPNAAAPTPQNQPTTQPAQADAPRLSSTQPFTVEGVSLTAMIELIAKQLKIN